MTLVEQFLSNNSMTDKEFDVLMNILGRTSHYVGANPPMMGIDVRNKAVWDEWKTHSLNDVLEEIAGKINKYFEANPDNKARYGRKTSDGSYKPFEVEDFYELDKEYNFGLSRV